MKVFLDVGAHLGQTIEVARAAIWRFDRIVSFEPAPGCWEKIESEFDHRCDLQRFGLWNEDAKIALNNPGKVGASMSYEKDPVNETVNCDFRDAGVWFRENLLPTDDVWVKINVEGAEAEIIQRLSETRTLALIDHLLIHFDVRKVPSKRHLEGVMRKQLDLAEVDYISASDIQFGGVYRGTRNWLAWSHSRSPLRDLRYRTLSRVAFKLRRPLYPIKRRATAAR